MPPTPWTARKDRLVSSAREKLRDVRRRRTAARSKRTFKSLRDTLTGLAVAALLLGGMYVASDGAWPPLLAVESGSMMHPTSQTPYGRFGTIDVGDVLLVRSVDPDDIRTWAEGGPDRYGRPGDVIVFARDGNRENVSIVHRAMARVDVIRHEDGGSTYVVHWLHGQQLTFGDEGIYLPELGFSEAHGFTPANGYKPRYAGFITKGDNPSTNAPSDQAGAKAPLVDPTWIEGRAHGEVPWLGLTRLIFAEQTNPQIVGWERVGNAFAPVDLWTCYFVTLAVIVLVPLTWDTIRLWRRHRARRREEKAWEREMQRRADERRAKQAEERAKRGPVEFQPLTR